MMKDLLPIGTEVWVTRPEDGDTSIRAIIRGYDIGNTKYRLSLATMGWTVSRYPTDGRSWALRNEVREIDEGLKRQIWDEDGPSVAIPPARPRTSVVDYWRKALFPFGRVRSPKGHQAFFVQWTISYGPAAQTMSATWVMQLPKGLSEAERFLRVIEFMEVRMYSEGQMMPEKFATIFYRCVPEKQGRG